MIVSGIATVRLIFVNHRRRIPAWAGDASIRLSDWRAQASDRQAEAPAF